MNRFLQKIFHGSTIALLALSCFQGAVVHAAALTSVEDVMSDQLVGAVSDHQIRFVTPTGVDASSDTIQLTFEADFSLGSVDFSDIDLLHGPVTGLETDETLAATAAAGTWGVSASGQDITFTAPTDAALGEISASDIVTIRIGTGATGGVNQITNPTVNGIYHINITGTFGDAGGVTLSLLDTHSVSFSATVAPPTGHGGGGGGGGGPPGGGGGGGPGVDGTPPVISNVQAINITQTTADITWQTDESADSLVGYGGSIAYEEGTLFSPTLVVSHTTPLSGLLPDTTYHFYITSADAVGNSATTADFTFTTLAPARAPFISNVRVVAITDSSATVLWDTDIPASSVVDFGETTGYGLTASSGGFVTNHAVNLTGLTASTIYHFQVTSAEASGLSTTSADNSFVTLGDVTPPGNVFAFSATPGDEENTLTWINPTDLDFSHVVIRARTDHFPSDRSDGRLVYVGSGELFVDSGLTNGVTYYYGNFAQDSSGNSASGAFAEATPAGVLPPVVPPPVPPIPPPVVPGPVTPPSPAIPSGAWGAGVTSTTPPVPGTTTSTSTTPPYITTPPAPIQPRIQAFYFGGAGQIPLITNAQGTVISAAGQTLLVQIPTNGFTTPPVSGTVAVGGSVYALTPLPGQSVMAATFIPSFVTGKVEALYTLTFDNQTSQTGRNTLDIMDAGHVLENTLQGTAGIPSATVSLFDAKTGLLWSGEGYGQANPAQTNEDGSYAFVVPNGDYLIQASKERYLTKEKNITVTDHLVAEDIILTKIVPVPLIGGVLEALQSEPAKKTANVLAVVATVAIVANVVNAASLASMLYYLWFLFTQPILLLGRRKRKQWGLVYNSLSKEPINLAAVRLTDVKSGRIIQTHVTDRDGRFFFKVKKGKYTIAVAKNGFNFHRNF